MGPLLGLDPGTRTLGIALSDQLWTLASPVETLRRGKLLADAARLHDLISQEQVAGIVLGLPLNMDGSAGPRAQSVRGYRRALAEQIDLPMLFWDERLSSAAADETLRDAGASRARREAQRDAAAAAIILTDALPTLRALRADLPSA
ncbi:MAG: Holliday junction resolvase RuvX [Devosiaceae bacterium]|nr:Holliday junction resolvase RuvX [Devosiaceae bacterium MH13]